MGLQESKPIERRPSKTKSNLNEKSLVPQDFAEFSSQLSTLSCIRSTSQSTFEYIVFQKLPFTGHYSALPLCKRLSTSYNSIFICYDCSTDNLSYLCENCFEKGSHDSHKFSVFPGNDQWRQTFCRCGDSDFLKKKITCQTHAQAPKLSTQAIDKKDSAKFAVYFNQAFKILFSLMQKQRAAPLLNSIFGYFKKLTDDNLYFSKIICEFFLQKNIVDNQSSNLLKFIKLRGFANFKWYSVFRNLSFATQYRNQILRQMINGQNEQPLNSLEYHELIINFAGKIQYLNKLAKDENLVIGLSLKQDEQSTKYNSFFNLIIKTQSDANQIWKCLVRNKKIKNFINQDNIIRTIIKSLMKDQDYIVMILEQLLTSESEQTANTYIIYCLMILSPDFFLYSSAKKTAKTPSKNSIDKLEKAFGDYYTRLFLNLNTHSQSEQIPTDLLLLLPFFSFGQAIATKFWDEIQKRVEIISKNKQKKVIREASMNIFELITNFLSQFMTWDHQVLRNAKQMSLINYTKYTKLVQKILIEYFDKYPKLPRQQLLTNVDIYTQKQRVLAKQVMKKNLRYNPRKGKYYNITKRLPNNTYNFQELCIGYPVKFTEWQQFVGKKFFTDAFYRLVPTLIKTAQKALMEDMEMVKIVSNISVCVCLLNKNQRQNIKQITRNFVKQIPDVRENVYYVLAKIRDRLQLDIDDAEEAGKKGSKKPKLDLIVEIRDKKYRQIKLKQQKMRLKWLKQAQKLQEGNDQEEIDDKICHICKQKDTDKRRFVYPCNFTRNNVVSTLLHSQVTDLDINICLHKVHEDCYQKQRQKGECPICKFQINCYIPQKILAEQSYTKNWMRNFENIVTTINMESGKSFNSDWATIFLTYLVYSKSFKVLLKNTQIQQKQRAKVDQLLIAHYKSQLDKWPQLTKQAIKKAQKTVKGQVRRESNIKKVVKTLVLDLVLQQITNQPFKNVKRVQKKFRELINLVGTENAEKINECFAWSRDNEAIKQVFSSNVVQQKQQLFKIRKLPQKASEYLQKTSIKCPMCNKYQPTTWECLFCEKISCQNCINPRFHCERDHRGSGIILHLSDAKYEFYHENRQIQMDSLYRNEYRQGWKRNDDPQGWQACTDEIYKFFDKILHSENPMKRPQQYGDNSDNEGEDPNRGWNNQRSPFGNQGGFGFNQQMQENEMVQDEQNHQQEEHEEEEHEEEEHEQEHEQEEQQEQEQEQQEEEASIPLRASRAPRAPKKAKPAKRRN